VVQGVARGSRREDEGVEDLSGTRRHLDHKKRKKRRVKLLGDVQKGASLTSGGCQLKDSTLRKEH